MVRSRAQIGDGYGQLGWVILLLAIAVILPTLCLLWFMTRAVKNERLAVRQRLIDVYENKARTLGQRLDSTWKDALQPPASSEPNSIQ